MNGVLTPVSDADCRVMVNEPRIIAVRLKPGRVSILCTSAHLPQQQYGRDYREVLYASLRSLFHAPYQSDIVVLGIDANARPPCGFDHVTGEVEHGEPDDFGFDFAAVLSELHLWAPATFSSCHSRQTATWKHVQGHASQVGFICLGGDAYHTDVRSWV